MQTVRAISALQNLNEINKKNKRNNMTSLQRLTPVRINKSMNVCVRNLYQVNLNKNL